MKKKVFLKSKALPCVCLVMAAAGILFYYAARSSWVFFDATLKLEGFSLGLLYVMAANIIIIAAAAVVRLYEIKTKKAPLFMSKAYSLITAISSFLSFVFFVAGFTMMASNIGKESSDVYFLYLRSSLFDAAFFMLIPFLALFLPKLGCKAKKAAVCVTMVIVFVLGSLMLFPGIKSHKITCPPSVIDNGKEYSVVFATSDYGTGYIQYTYEGEEYKVYDATAGRLDTDSRIHSIRVPYEHLRDNSYKVGSLQVFEEYSYGSRTGKETVSEEYFFPYIQGGDTEYLVISDWHTQLERAYSAVSYIGNYDAVILMGDATPGVDFEQEVVKNIVEFAGNVSEGTRPVIYVRGNHETRGSYAGKLAGALGLDNFYYTAEIGDCSFIVLDSGEDKDDSHHEYGGMTDYNTYRAGMIKWLEKEERENDRVIALSHSWRISDVEAELSEKGWQEIDRLGATLMISGHTHACRLIGETEEEKAFLSNYPDITGYMDGGNTKDKFVASKMTLSAEEIHLEAYDNFGEKVFEHRIDF